MGSYKWGYKSPIMGYKYSYPTYDPTYNYPKPYNYPTPYNPIDSFKGTLLITLLWGGRLIGLQFLGFSGFVRLRGF